jgi:hypothetical protein
MVVPTSFVAVRTGACAVPTQVVTYSVDDARAVSFEIEPVEGFVSAGIEEIAGRVKTAIEPVLAAARAVLDGVRDAAPSSVEVKFGVKVTVTANWLVAKASTEGNFEVTMSWKRESS